MTTETAPAIATASSISGINLTKGRGINLSKAVTERGGTDVFFAGITWGKIKKEKRPAVNSARSSKEPGFFGKIFNALGFGSSEKPTTIVPQPVGPEYEYENIDLDLSAYAFPFDHETGVVGNIIECSYKHQNVTGMRSSGDDLIGSASEGSEYNEVIRVITGNFPESINTVVFAVNSFSGKEFSELPFVKTSVFVDPEFNPLNVTGKIKKAIITDNILADYDMVNEAGFKKCKTFIVGALLKDSDNEWHFKAIGEMKSFRWIEDMKSFLTNSPSETIGMFSVI